MKRLGLGLIVALLLAVIGPPLWYAAFPLPQESLPPAQTFVDLGTGNRMHVLDTGGEGKPVVLVHGLPGSAYDWRALARPLAEAGRRVVSVDRIGYGHSSPRSGDEHSIRANALDVLALLEALELREVTLVGWSYGGVVALDATSIDDERIAALLLVGSGGPSSDDDAPPEAGLFARFFYSDPVLRWRSAAQGLSRGLMQVLSAQAFSDQPMPEWWLTGVYANFARWETTLTFRDEAFHRITEPLRFEEIAVPTTVVHGDDDRLAPVAIGRYLAEKIEGARYVEVSGGSHALPVTHVALMVDEIIGASSARGASN